jgi:hypothetical protein
MRTVSISALNIVMPSPHSPERYVELFNNAYKLRRPINIRGDYVALLGACRDDVIEGRPVVVGELYKYFELKVDSQWFNTLENKIADENEKAQISIPGHLKPHFEVTPFVFFPHKHRMLFISKEIDGAFTPNQAHRLFEGLLNADFLKAKYGQVEITIEPSIDTLSNILEMSTIKYLHIEVKPPNPDDQEAAERRLFENLYEQGADKQVVELHSNQQSGLTPSNEIRLLAKIAQSNGNVTGRGIDEGGSVITLSTQEHPLEERITCNPKIQTRLSMLISTAFELLPRIIRRELK